MPATLDDVIAAIKAQDKSGQKISDVRSGKAGISSLDISELKRLQSEMQKEIELEKKATEERRKAMAEAAKIKATTFGANAHTATHGLNAISSILGGNFSGAGKSIGAMWGGKNGKAIASLFGGGGGVAGGAAGGAEGVGAAAAGLGSVASASVAVAKAWLQLPWTIKSFADSVSEGNKRFREFSGSMAAVFANSDFRESQRAFRSGEALAGSAGFAERGRQDLADQLAPIENFGQNLQNLVAGGLANLTAAILKNSGAAEGFAQATKDINKFFGVEEGPESPPLNQWVNDMANQAEARLAAKHRMRQGLPPRADKARR